MWHHDDRFFTIVADKWQRRTIEMKAAAYQKHVDRLIFDAVKAYTTELKWEETCSDCGGTQKLTYDEPFEYTYVMEGQGRFKFTVKNVPMLKCPDCGMMTEDLHLGVLIEDALDDEVNRRARFRLPLTAEINLNDLIYPKEN